MEFAWAYCTAASNNGRESSAGVFGVMFSVAIPKPVRSRERLRTDICACAIEAIASKNSATRLIRLRFSFFQRPNVRDQIIRVRAGQVLDGGHLADAFEHGVSQRGVAQRLHLGRTERAQLGVERF